jgi:hypothetical protein
VSFLFASGLSYAQAMLPRESIGFKATVLAFAFLFPLLCGRDPHSSTPYLRQGAQSPANRRGYEPFRSGAEPPNSDSRLGNRLPRSILESGVGLLPRPNANQPIKW